MPYKDPVVAAAYAKEYNAQRYCDKRDEITARNKAYVKAHPEVARAKSKRYAARHPDKVKAQWKQKTERLKIRRKADPNAARKSDFEVRNRYINRHLARVLLSRARSRAALRGLPFDLVEADIIIPAACPVFGTPFVRVPGQKGKANSFSPSLDRLVPALGYVRGNVRVISNRANHLKSDATLQDLECLVAYMRSAQADALCR